MSRFCLIEAMEVEGFGGGGVVAAAFGDVQVAGVFDGRDDGGADGGQVGGPAAGPAGGGIFAERQVPDILSGCKTGIACVTAERAGRSGVSSSPTMVKGVAHVAGPRRQGSEQRRQRAPHLAEVLQKLSVKRFTATSCNGLGTPGEPASAWFRLVITWARSW